MDSRWSKNRRYPLERSGISAAKGHVKAPSLDAAGFASYETFMTIRLYDSAWVILREFDTPQQVRKDPANPAVFRVGDHRYDIDGRAFFLTETVPEILQMLSLQAAREYGLSTQYVAPKALMA